MFKLRYILAFVCVIWKTESQQIHEQENQVGAFSYSSQDPEIHMSTPQIIERWGYPVEDHEMTTEDGYILHVHRIPRGKGQVEGNVTKPVVLLLHGLLASSSNWVTNLPNQSLGFLLADAGFDVWLGNVRGNTYCKKHITFPTTSGQFWTFSWEQMAKYDLPAMVDYALKKTGQKQLHYVGHSQGSLMMFTKAAMDDSGEFQAKIKSFTALGPVARMAHMDSPLRFLAKFSGPLQMLFSLIGKHEFLPNSKLIDMWTRVTCETSLKFICTNSLFLMAGFDINNLNVTRIPVYFTHTPAGTSVRNLMHFAQGISSGIWRHYDFGYIGNRVVYGQWTPPAFDPKKVKLPVHAYWGGRDTLANPVDAAWLLEQLPNVVESVYDPSKDHLSYVWGLNAADTVYHPIIKTFKEEESMH